VKASLRDIKPTEEASYDHSVMLLDKCRGLDRTLIQDDNGGLTKQVSVEDSFRRGTMRTKEAVWKAMEELFVRLPKLLEERRSASPNTSKAYATTIRFTARVVDPSLGIRRRPFKTQSKQSAFDGKNFMILNDQKRRNMLATIVTPLLNQLVLDNPDAPGINVTRMNLAVTNFQDMVPRANDLPTINTFVSQSVQLSQSTLSLPQKRERQDSSKHPINSGVQVNYSDQIDRSVIAELPPDIAAEVKRAYLNPLKPKKKTRQTIDNFFQRKKP